MGCESNGSRDVRRLQNIIFFPLSPSAKKQRKSVLGMKAADVLNSCALRPCVFLLETYTKHPPHLCFGWQEFEF